MTTDGTEYLPPPSKGFDRSGVHFTRLVPRCNSSSCRRSQERHRRGKAAEASGETNCGRSRNRLKYKRIWSKPGLTLEETAMPGGGPLIRPNDTVETLWFG